VTERVQASPTKDFFVTMITRDIALTDCILDLLDNAIDGARRTRREKQAVLGAHDFRAKIRILENRFEIEDNCGGMSRKDAVEYAFRFGRKKDVQPEIHGIGVYGIGLKRAVFKLGKRARITSRHGDDSFAVVIDVEKWLSQGDNDWDFELVDVEPLPTPGLRVVVEELHEQVGKELNDDDFVADLRRTIARDYSFILAKHFDVLLMRGEVKQADENQYLVQPYAFNVKEGAGLEPARTTYSVGAVNVEIVAGFMADPPDDIEPTIAPDRIAPYYGWYVACNDRIVLDGNKNELTVWGRGEFPTWHNQYNGFIGIVRFESDDPALLPWTTTKRALDQEAPLYVDALEKMKAMTRSFIAYTNARKQNLDEAKQVESQAALRPIEMIQTNSQPAFPTFSIPARDTTTIQYRVDKKRVRAAAEALGNRDLSNKDVGEKTFEYFERNEVE
jgi:hypothetical protein